MNSADREYVHKLLTKLRDACGHDTLIDAAEDVLFHYNAFPPATVRMVEEYLREPTQPSQGE